MLSLLKMYIKSHKRNTRFDVYVKKLPHLVEKAVRNSMISNDTEKYINKITPTEKKVLKLINKAYKNKEIASEFNISIRTVKAHISNIYKKLEVKNRAQGIIKVVKIK